MTNPDRLIDLFHEAKIHPPGPERERFLAEVCRNDPELRAQADSLLQAHESAGAFLENSCFSPTTLLAEQPGDRIGPYTLRQRLGEGGWGVVHAADQEQPVRRRVALKIIKPGMDTRQVVARFEAERQALAVMDHPHIAKVFDAGTTRTGRPFFVMELVQGLKITDFCDQHQLSPHQRLALFIQVCQAIQHAHQKGIIHRDIKPSNILVSLQESVAVPKVIDFGIAKATEGRLNDATVYTQLQQFIGTPAYMSPEQVGMSGRDIDTRSDIYSLGVLLYELLVGSTPFDTKELMDSGLEVLSQTIRTKEAMRPSTRLTQMSRAQLTAIAEHRGTDVPRLIHLLKGDLDWIVMKCLEKDRKRRYETANGLALDLKRYLHHEPVSARPPSTIYRISKAWQRHRWAFVSAAAVSLALILGAAASSWQALRATRAQFQAEKSLYASDMLLAGQALSQGNLGRTRELLARHAARPPDRSSSARDLRGWEWRHLWERARGDKAVVLRGHSNAVPAALLLDDGRTVFSASQDRTLKFWDLETQSLLASLSYPDDPRRPALSPNGRMIAVDGQFGYWCVLDAQTRQRLHGATHDQPVLGMSFSRDSQWLAVGGVDAILILRTGTWQTVRKITRGESRASNRLLIATAFSPDGSRLAYSSADDRIVIHHLNSGEEVTVGTNSRSEALSLCFSQDGQFLISADRDRMSVWQVTPPALVQHITHHGEQVLCLALSPDGALLASSSGDQTVKLWNTTTWEEVSTLRGHENEVYSVAFSADGQRLVSSGKDESIRIWNIPSAPARSNLLPLIGAFDWVLPKKGSTGRALGFNLKERRATLVNLLTRESTSQELPPVFTNSTVLCVSADAWAAAIALEDGSIELWKTEPWQKQRTLKASASKPLSLALSGSHRRLAVARADRTMDLWDLDQERVIESLSPFPEPVGGEKDSLLTPVHFWSHDRRVTRFAPANRRSPDLIEIFLVPEKARRLIRSTHKDIINDLAISHQGRLLATSSWDNTVKLWDVRTGRELDTLRGQMVGFTSVAFTPDDSRLVAGAWDGSVSLWDTSNRQLVATWKAHQRHSLVSFADAGRVLVTVGQSKSGSSNYRESAIWRAPTFAEIDAVQAQEESEVIRP